MTDSVKGKILEAIAIRLGAITLANGYRTDVKKVYWDQIPMGIELSNYELPAIFLLDRADILTTRFPIIEGTWEIDLQLWHNGDQGDIIMSNFVADVFKAIYANSPVAQIKDAFRMQPSIVEFKPGSIATDLNMIEANRIYEVSFSIKYRTPIYEM
jgi:hypothetical protein